MKIIGKEPLWEGKFLRTVLITYSDSPREGRDSSVKLLRGWESVERVNCGGVVCVVPFTENGEVILIRQFRPPVDGYVIELPAGLSDIGEPLEKAAERELLEETGFAAGRMIYLTKGPLSSGSSAEVLTAFIATDLSFVGPGQRDETEDIEVLAAPSDRLSDYLLDLQGTGNYIDLKIYGLVELAKKIIA